MNRDLKCRTCLKCGWVYFGVSREYAEDEVRRFGEFFHASTPEIQEMYGGHPSSIKMYEQCWCGNTYENFRDSLPGDCPNGVTMSPIIVAETEQTPADA